MSAPTVLPQREPHLERTAWWAWAWVTKASVSRVMGAMKQVGGRMGAGSVLSSSTECSRDKASGLVLREPGRYDRENLKLLKVETFR